MKILLVSDLHANWEAVSVLPTDYDQLWVLGDLLNYGPEPRQVIDFVRQNATLVVRGNHDHAIGFDTDPRCSAPYRAMALEMARITQAAIGEPERAFLRGLPLTITTESHGHHFHLCHAAPTDPLFAYCPPESPRWKQEIRSVEPGYLLVGHTHLPFQREIEDHIILNPGSVGQPKTGVPEASYAIWEGGRWSLHSVVYDYEKTAAKIARLDLSPAVKRDLITVLHGGDPVKSDTSGKDRKPTEESV
jgi:protein phosphatase